MVGLPDWQIGMVLGAFGIASLVGRPIAGVVSDRVGARPVMLAGAVSLAVGALGVASTANVFVLFGLRVLQAAGYVAFTTAGTALVVSLVAPTEHAGRLAVFGSAANLAISLAPAASAALLEVAPVTAGLVAAAACAALGGALALFLPRTAPTTSISIARRQPFTQATPARLSFFAQRNHEASRGASRESASPAKRGSPGDEKRHVDITNLLNLESWRHVWLPMLAAALLGAGFAAFFQFAPILADRRGVSSGALYTVYGAAIIATRFCGGGLLDRIRVGRIVGVAAVLMALGHTVIASTDGLAPLLVAAALIATSGGLFHPALIAHHAMLLPDAPGRATAAFYLAFDLGIGLGSWLFGFMLQLAGLPGLYWTAAALTGAVLLLARRLDGGPANVEV
jgi:predicted MFS family arabinose efflux permease